MPLPVIARLVPDDSTRGLPQPTLGAAVMSITLTGLDMPGHQGTETETCMLAETGQARLKLEPRREEARGWRDNLSPSTLGTGRHEWLGAESLTGRRGAPVIRNLRVCCLLTVHERDHREPLASSSCASFKPRGLLA